ncbi:hypothetical protein FACS1894161_1180 [Spirochaetia bacterium]|nr:hypothetical protein FACS1894161_1180 [Spirochaetia bacterium]
MAKKQCSQGHIYDSAIYGLGLPILYNDPKFDKKWFSEIYTGIEEYHQIGDLFEIKQ